MSASYLFIAAERLIAFVNSSEVSNADIEANKTLNSPTPKPHKISLNTTNVVKQNQIASNIHTNESTEKNTVDSLENVYNEKIDQHFTPINQNNNQTFNDTNTPLTSTITTTTTHTPNNINNYNEGNL